MEEEIRDFHKQFLFKPSVLGEKTLMPANRFVVCGMGGSHLGADMLKIARPSIDLHVHSDYGIPAIPGEVMDDHLFIAVSYSGNTEETIDFARQAKDSNANLVIISKGGQLIEFAEDNTIPHIKLPDVNIQPRLAIGYQTVALAKFLADGNLMQELSQLAEKMTIGDLESDASNLAQTLSDRVPVVYSSHTYQALAYYLKIVFNETAKVPAFFNTFPELNHNEMEGFTPSRKTSGITDKFAFVFLESENDSSDIRKRMSVTREIYNEEDYATVSISVRGESLLEKVFNTILTGYWAGLKLACHYGVDPEEVPAIEEFKKRIA